MCGFAPSPVSGWPQVSSAAGRIKTEAWTESEIHVTFIRNTVFNEEKNEYPLWPHVSCEWEWVQSPV